MKIQVTLIHCYKTLMILVITVETSKIFMDFVFERRNNTYNLRSFQEFATKRKRTVKMGLETLNYKSSQLWSTLPENLRQINLLGQFKESDRNGTVLTVPADYVSYTCQTSGFCSIYLLVIYIYKHLILAW